MNLEILGKKIPASQIGRKGGDPYHGRHVSTETTGAAAVCIGKPAVW